MKPYSFVGLGACLVMSASSCAIDTTSTVGEDSTTTTYTDIADFSGIDQGAWYDLRSKLDQEFYAVCGDTFCEGDYANLTSLGFECSVTSKVGNVHDCVWTFAGSLEVVDPKTAAISVDQPSFQCHVSPKTTAAKLITLLSASSDAIDEKLPGTSGSLYDELGDCFQHPINKTPVPYFDDPTPVYVEATDYYTRGTYQAQWTKAKAALKGGFDNVCGDTFCDGDYGFIQSMDFVCSVTKSTGNIKECAWEFAGSYAEPNKTGADVVTAKSWRCEVPVKGTLSQLMNVVNANVVDDVLHRNLPGETSTAYDAILNCLP